MVGTLFAGARVDENVPLAPLTTLRVGPVASRVITCTSTEQVVATLRHLDAQDPQSLLVLAGGSNVVIADELADLTVIRLSSNDIQVDGNILRAGAGAVWDDVVVAAIGAGLGGLECLSGIPGSAGATPVQNVGAYGVEVADTITRVRMLDRRSGQVRWVAADELGFGYRTSVLKHSDAATVLEVEFALDPSGRSAPLRYGELVTALDATAGERADPAAVREAVLALRKRKGMVLDEADHDTWSVGSFFTNPVVTPQFYQELADRADRPGAALSGTGRRQTGRGLARRAGRLRQGLPGGRGRALPAVHQACAGRDQSRRGRHGRRADAGPRGARRRARRVWRHIGARAGAGRLRPVAPARTRRAGFRRYLDVVSTARGLSPVNRRRALATLAVGVFAPNVLAACVGGSSKQAEKAKPPAEAALTFRPADKATKVLPTAPISVEVRDGWFQHVALTNSDGKAVAGALNRDRTLYTLTEPLGYDVTYTWSGSAVGHDGKPVAVKGEITTVAPTKVVDGGFQLADGQTVGVAAPIIIQFDAPIADKAAVERALKITTEPPVEGSWAWLPDESEGARVHWRSREYYPAGTKVNVDAKLYGLAFGDGAYGKQDMSLKFDIGRRQVVKAEISSHRIQVVRDEGVIMDFRLQLRRGRQGAQRHPQRHPRGQREVLRLLHVQPGRRLQPRPRTLGGADLQQWRVHSRQPEQRRRAGQQQRHQRLRQPVDV